jgi:hypothetical protein
MAKKLEKAQAGKIVKAVAKGAKGAYKNYMRNVDQPRTKAYVAALGVGAGAGYAALTPTIRKVEAREKALVPIKEKYGNNVADSTRAKMRRMDDKKTGGATKSKKK